MAEISAKVVQELRQKTGAGMMDCKKALKENDGDMEKSIDWLRQKGIATAGQLDAEFEDEDYDGGEYDEEYDETEYTDSVIPDEEEEES
jgi:hypothetical protein